MKKVLTLMALALLISACNTVNGIGKDLEKAGQAVQKTSSGKE